MNIVGIVYRSDVKDTKRVFCIHTHNVMNVIYSQSFFIIFDNGCRISFCSHSTQFILYGSVILGVSLEYSGMFHTDSRVSAYKCMTVYTHVTHKTSQLFCICIRRKTMRSAS